MSVALATLILVCSGLPASAASGRTITTFVSTIDIQADSSITVQEDITVNFPDEGHGIYRRLPVYYTDTEKKVIMPVTVTSVTLDGSAIKYQASELEDDLSLKIGDPDTTITGSHTFSISYKLIGAVNFFSDHAELYWNATGSEWDMPIKEASAVIKLPKKLTSDQLNAQCFYGAYYSTTYCSSSVRDDLQSLEYKVHDLGIYQGMTIVAGFPKDAVAPHATLTFVPQNPDESFTAHISNTSLGVHDFVVGGKTLLPVVPTQYDITFSAFGKYTQKESITLTPGENHIYSVLLKDNPWPWVLICLLFLLPPIITFLILFSKWVRNGKDPAARPIAPEWQPSSELTPLQMGIVYDEKANPRDFSGELIYLAQKGYLSIREEKVKGLIWEHTTYTLVRGNKSFDTLPDFEQTILDGLFVSGGNEVSLASLKNSFYTSYDKAIKEAYDSLVVNKIYEKNPQDIKSGYTITGTLLVMIPLIFFSAIPFVNLFVPSFILSGIICILFAFIMPKKTKKGVDLLSHTKGLQEYIRTAEVDRIKFHSGVGPESPVVLFYGLIPYAIIFGLEDTWGKKFESLSIPQPTWYQGADTAHFAFSDFSHSINTFTSQALSSMTARPSSSGSSSSGGSWSGGSGFSGGFSGGGFGGGGGSSW